MDRSIKSFKFAVNGIKIAWKEEVNFRIEAVTALVVITALYYFGFGFIEKALCFLAIGLVLGVEILNTVVEDLCNKIEPNQDEVIGKIKDLSSASVLVVSFFSLLVGLCVFYNHFL